MGRCRSTDVMRVFSLLPLVLAAACGPADLNREYAKTGKTVKYELEISEVDWEVAPGAIYKAIAYNRQVPGPVLQANAGDRIELTLVNKTSAPHSAHTHVVRFPETDDGVHMGIAPPGGSVTVSWDAVFAGTFPYHDHAGEDGETDGRAAGLFGALVVHAPDAPRAQVENVVVLADMDPSRFASRPRTEGSHGFLHTLNGRAYEEFAPRFVAKVGDRVRWRVVSIGEEFHTFHVHGHRWKTPDGATTDNITLGPGSYATFDWVEDNPGEWLYHCHVPAHMEGGMMGVYEVTP
jgi:manganese oxidase